MCIHTSILGVKKEVVNTLCYVNSPDSIEPYPLLLIVCQLRDEGEMRYLHGGPPKLEDGNEHCVPHYLPAKRGAVGLARETLVPEEEQRHGNKNCPHYMPQFPPPEPKEPEWCYVTQVPYDWRGESVHYLSYEEKSTGQGVVQLDDLVVEQDEIGKPHAGCQVVEDVAHAVRQLP